MTDERTRQRKRNEARKRKLEIQDGIEMSKILTKLSERKEKIHEPHYIARIKGQRVIRKLIEDINDEQEDYSRVDRYLTW